jgi:hypothetical protein
VTEHLAVRYSVDSKNSVGKRRDVVSQAVARAEFADYGWEYPSGGSISEYHAPGLLPEKYRRVARRGAVARIALDGTLTSTPRVVADAEDIVADRAVKE